MATFVAATSGTTSATLPTGTATGDWVVLHARAATSVVLATPTGWTLVGTSLASASGSMMQAYRQYDGVWAMPTVTGATHTSANTIRPASGATLGVGASEAPTAKAAATNITWPALTLQVTAGTSQVLRAGVHVRPDVVLTAPTGHTLSPTSTGINPGFITVRVNTTTSAAAATTGGGTRSSAYVTAQVEVRDVAAATATPVRRVGKRVY